MDKQAEVVSGLQWLRGAVRSNEAREVCDAAIAYIQSTPSRDEVLEEAAREVESAGGNSTEFHARRVRALKATRPTRLFLRHDGVNGPIPSPDTRGTVEDRRKSAYGNATEGVRRGYDYSKLGRRSGDRARWIGEVAPVVECEHNWAKHYGGGFGCTKCPAWVNSLPSTQPAAPVVGPVCPRCDGTGLEVDLTRGQSSCCPCGVNPSTQPAQESPQPEKPGMVRNPAFRQQDNLYEALSRVGDEIIALLDARQGEK